MQVCTLDRCCEHQRTHLLTRLLQDVHMHSVYYYSSRNNVVVLFGTFKVQPFMYVQFVHLALGERVWGGSVSL